MAADITVIIVPSPCGLDLRPSVLEALYTRLPALFGEPHRLEDFAPQGAFKLEGDNPTYFANALVKEDLVYFLDSNNPKLRTDPWLIELLQEKGGDALMPEGTKRGLKTVSIPADVKWFIYIDDDGSESVQEHARVWR